MNRPEIWTTEDVAPSQRAAWWRALMDRQFNGLETDLYGDRSCDGRLVVEHLSQVTLARLEATRHRVTKAAGGHGDGDAFLKIVAPFEGEVWVEQHDRVAHARPGEWIIYDTGREYSVANPAAVDHLVIMLPRAMLYGTDLPVEELVARTMGGPGMVQVSLHAMRATYAEVPAMGPGVRGPAGDMVAQMVRLALLECAGRHAGGKSRQAVMQERIRGYVLRNLGDPRLSLDAIAAALRCSKRLLHESFRSSGQTLGAYILSQRVAACARDLRDPRLRDRPISEIAAARGFVNVTHFSRAFREQMGVSAREWRKDAGEQTADGGAAGAGVGASPLATAAAEPTPRPRPGRRVATAGAAADPGPA